MVLFNDILNYGYEITDETTSREFLEFEYLRLWNESHSGVES